MRACPPSFVYWRAFAHRYLGERCRMPQGDIGPVTPLEEADTEALLTGLPPMRGAE